MHSTWTRRFIVMRHILAISVALFATSTEGAAAVPSGAPDVGADPSLERTFTISIDAHENSRRLASARAVLRAQIDGRDAVITSLIPLEPDPSRAVTMPLLAHPWRLVIYVDPILLTADGQHRSMESLAHQAGRLTALGTVEIVVANPVPRTTLHGTRNPQDVARALRAAAYLRDTGSATLAEIRQRFQTAVPTLGSAWNTARPAAMESLFVHLQQATQHEQRLLVERIDLLSGWLVRHHAPAPAALIWPSNGWNADPVDFYLAGFESEIQEQRRGAGKHQDNSVREHTSQPRRGTESDVSLAFETDASNTGAEDPGSRDRAATGDVLHARLLREMPATDELGERLALDILQAGYVIMPIHAVSHGNRAAREAASNRLLRALTQITGSRTASSVESTAFMLDHLRYRQLVTLRLPEPMEGAVSLRLFTDQKRTGILGPRRLMPPSPEHHVHQQALLLQAQFGRAPGELFGCQVIRRQTRIIHGAQRVVAQLTCGVATDALVAQAHSARSSAFELAVTEGGRDAPRIVFREDIHFRHQLTAVDASLILASETTDIDIFVRLLGAHDRWFSRTVAVVDSDIFDATQPPSNAIAVHTSTDAPTPIHLVPFDAMVVAGGTPVEVQIFDPAVSRVVYHLDDEQVAVAERAPFRIWLGLPAMPTPVLLRATAYDDAGQRLGEDRLALNQSYDRLRVTIETPEQIETAGRYEVVVNVSAGLDHPTVDLFWNDRLLTTLLRPPYRAQLDLPAVHSGDFLRAVARRDTERGEEGIAEDVVVVGAGAFGEEVPVSLIELFAVVEDRHGRLIDDLDRDDFQVLEDGHPQSLTTFANASDTPLTVALVLDVSDSMQAMLPWVKKAARRFIDDVLEPGDQAMLLAFDQRPSLRLPATDDMGRITAAIQDLDLGLGTALHDTVVFALLQLRAVAGRKALVILTDGVDQHSRLPESVMLGSARRAGIPLYVVRLRGEKADPYGKAMAMLRRMARRSGAGLYRVSDEQSLTHAYDTIARELRSQYLLTYHSNQPIDSAGWREVEVRLMDQGLRTRTIPGYEHHLQ